MNIAYELVEPDAGPLDSGGERMLPATAVTAAPATTDAVAGFGPFRVIDAHTASLVDVTDLAKPRAVRRAPAAISGHHRIAAGRMPRYRG
ncbi:hypothetical protein ACFSTD_16710 [Novosphingobium colocasiae]